MAPDDDDDGDELEDLLEQAAESDSSSQVQQQPTVATRRSTRHNAGIRRLYESYEWNLMNLSLGAAIRNFGDKGRDACKAELEECKIAPSIQTILHPPLRQDR